MVSGISTTPPPIGPVVSLGQTETTPESLDVLPVVEGDRGLDVASTNDAGGENGGSGLTAEGEVLNTVEDATKGVNEQLNATSSLGANGAVLDTVAQANKVRSFGDKIGDRPADSVGSWDVEGVKGFAMSFVVNEVDSDISTHSLSQFPLRIDLSDEGATQDEVKGQDRLIVRSILRDQTLYLEVNYSILSNSLLEATSYSVQQANGDPLPEWLRIYDDGVLLTGKPPVDLQTMDLRVEVTLTDGTDIVRYIQVDVTSGEIVALERLDPELLKLNGVPIFSQQVNELSDEFSRSVNELMSALEE